MRDDDLASAMALPRSRGALNGSLLILLGIWGAIIPFVGPYFDYGFGADTAWTFTLDRLWLSILPGAAVLLGGLLLAPSANRVAGGLGAWLALAGGVWFVTGPAISELWGNPGPAAPIGAPFGGNMLHTAEYIGFFYGLGAVVTALAAFALGRLAVRSVRDPAAAWQRERDVPRPA